MAHGFNFRNSAAFVTDGAGETYTIDDGVNGGENYPTTRDGQTFGWVTNHPQTRNRNSGIDARFAGVHFVTAPSQFSWRLDLASAGTYEVRLSMGDDQNAQTVYFELYDNTTLLTSQGETAVSAANYMDATGVVRTSPTDWINNNAAYTATFATTTLLLKIGFSSGTNTSVLTHVHIQELANPSAFRINHLRPAIFSPGIAR